MIEDNDIETKNVTEKSPLYAEDINYVSEKSRYDLRYDVEMKEYPFCNIGDVRTVFQHDCDSIVYSQAFRRLMHKTQVTYPGTEKNEHTRTRLTHTLEVYRIAHSIGAYLHLNLDLIDAIAFGHDLGHTPFGHEGEQFLDDFCNGINIDVKDKKSRMNEDNPPKLFFDFKHNYQSVRVLTELEGKPKTQDNPNHYGLNISRKTLEGILKHSRIYRDGKKDNFYAYPEIVTAKNDWYKIHEEYCVLSVEGQIVALADEIAQVTHDLEDALTTDYGVGTILRKSISKIFSGKLSSEMNIIKNSLPDGVLIEVKDCSKSNKNNTDIIRDINPDMYHEFISWLVGYLVATSQSKISGAIDEYVDDKRTNKLELFPLTKNLADEKDIFKGNELYKFLRRIEKNYIINNNRINRENGKADYILQMILTAYLKNPAQIPDYILERYSIKPNLPDVVKHEISATCIDDPEHLNVRYVFGAKKGLEKTAFMDYLRNDPEFIRSIVDGIASMTDQYALNEYKMLYLGDPAYREL